MKKILRLDTANSFIRKMEYAVRGEVAIKAELLQEQLKKSPKSLPFPSIVNANIGNPQQLNQKPITFYRQVASLLEYPQLMEKTCPQETLLQLFPKDAIERAKIIMNSLGAPSIGAYSHSQGIPKVRENVAKFIEKRDGIASKADDIFLTNGASPAVQLVLKVLINHDKVGVMIPIPQYPLYSASIAMFNARPVHYYLEEEKAWGLDMNGLRQSLKDSREKGIDVKALVIINPGNPTGNCLNQNNMKDIIKLCFEERLVLLADEVYQGNTYDSTLPFVSFKKVLNTMEKQIAENVELFSFHSISKGIIGECGRRGGYVECTNIDQAIKDLMYKVASVNLCPAVNGQIMVDLMVKPPKEGDESFPLYQRETSDLYNSLKRRAKKLVSALNSWEGVSCVDASGALYAFPKISLPSNAIEEAKKLGKEADQLYCLFMLEKAGVCVVAGSGFGQKQGTWHFRTTFLPPEEQLDKVLNRMGKAHAEFMQKYK